MSNRIADTSRPMPDAPAVLVTGGAGYIGSHACKALAQCGYLPVTYDNLTSGHRWAVRWGPCVEGDLADRALVAQTLKAHRVQAVLHFAGHWDVGESMREPAKYFRNNFVNTIALLEAMQETAVNRIVFSSTCAVYGMPERSPMGEDHAQCPVNPYGESKLAVEKLLQWWDRAHGVQWMALRYFNAAGADPDGEIGEEHDPETHLIPVCSQAALGERDGVDLYGVDYPTADGTAIRDYIHVTDLADAHVRALRGIERGEKSGALNLGTGSGHSVREVIAMVREVSGRDFSIRECARRPGDAAELVADPGSAYRMLGWKPRYSALHTIVDTAWRWHSGRYGKDAHGAMPANAGRAGE